MRKSRYLKPEDSHKMRSQNVRFPCMKHYTYLANCSSVEATMCTGGTPKPECQLFCVSILMLTIVPASRFHALLCI